MHLRSALGRCVRLLLLGPTCAGTGPSSEAYGARLWRRRGAPPSRARRAIALGPAGGGAGTSHLEADTLLFAVEGEGGAEGAAVAAIGAAGVDSADGADRGLRRLPWLICLPSLRLPLRVRLHRPKIRRHFFAAAIGRRGELALGHFGSPIRCGPHGVDLGQVCTLEGGQAIHHLLQAGLPLLETGALLPFVRRPSLLLHAPQAVHVHAAVHELHGRRRAAEGWAREHGERADLLQRAPHLPCGRPVLQQSPGLPQLLQALLLVEVEEREVGLALRLMVQLILPHPLQFVDAAVSGQGWHQKLRALLHVAVVVEEVVAAREVLAV
mmetsp:Transcript_127483/g.408027  ORF Transcript_127483/g.408027 Transcript_127483/m.408027 type:complete len:325 (+) Transcript_127483:34-1008(+)